MPTDPHPVEDERRWQIVGVGKNFVPHVLRGPDLSSGDAVEVIPAKVAESKLAEVEGERDAFADEAKCGRTWVRAERDGKAFEKARADKAEADLAQARERIESIPKEDGIAEEFLRRSTVLAALTTPSTEEQRCGTCNGAEVTTAEVGRNRTVQPCPDCSAPTGTEETLRAALLDDDGPVLLEIREAISEEMEGSAFRDEEGSLCHANDPAVEQLGNDVSDRVKAKLAAALSAPIEGEEPGVTAPCALTRQEAAELVPLIRKANAGIATKLTAPTDRIADRLDAFAKDAAPATPEPEGDDWPEWATVYSYLCGNCGEVRPADSFGRFIYDYEGRFGPEGELVPTPDGEENSVNRCPACGFDHEDNDTGSGTWAGTRAEMEYERTKLLAEAHWVDGWIETWKDLAEAAPSIPVGDREAGGDDA